eukprot:15649402-Heterocapsa_arctica.AAC.1
METSLAFVMYEDMGDKMYAMALDRRLEDPETIWTSKEMKATLVKCILAMGYLSQIHNCDQLEDIMELVVWIEATLKGPETTGAAATRSEEGKPVSTKRFQQGIDMLKEMLEVQMMEITQQAQKTRGVVRETQQELILKTLEATVAHTRAEEN